MAKGGKAPSFAMRYLSVSNSKCVMSVIFKLAPEPLQLQSLAGMSPYKEQVKKGKTWGWWMRENRGEDAAGEPRLKVSILAFFKERSLCSTGWGEHIWSECKGPVQRGDMSLPVVTHSPLEMSVSQRDQLFPLTHKRERAAE